MDALNCCYFLFRNKVTENARLGPQGCLRKLHYRGIRSPQHSIIQYLIIVEPGSLASSHAFLPSRTCRQCPTSTSTRLARPTDVSNTWPLATTFYVTQVSGASVYLSMMTNDRTIHDKLGKFKGTSNITAFRNRQVPAVGRHAAKDQGEGGQGAHLLSGGEI